MNNPIDKLPIQRPLEDSVPTNPAQFYYDVVQHLVPDILKIQENGIPIDLNKVQELDKQLDTILLKVEDTLANNPIILQFIQQMYKQLIERKIEDTQHKSRGVSFYLKEYNPKNKVHKAYVINYYLRSINREEMILPEWNKVDRTRLLQVISDKFLQDLCNDNIQEYMKITVNKAMEQLAKDKADIFNKNQQAKRIAKINQTPLPKFNPASSTQKQQLFAMLGIESENETASGNPQFDRKELERIQKWLETLLDERIGEDKQGDCNE